MHTPAAVPVPAAEGIRLTGAHRRARTSSCIRGRRCGGSCCSCPTPPPRAATPHRPVPSRAALTCAARDIGGAVCWLAQQRWPPRSASCGLAADVGRHGRGGGPTTARGRPRPPPHFQRHPSDLHRGTTGSRLAVVGPGGHHPRRLVQLRPAGQPRPSQRATDPSRVPAAGRGRRGPDEPRRHPGSRGPRLDPPHG